MSVSTAPREPFTCPACYEQRGENVPLTTQITSDARAVEEVLTARCPTCGYETPKIRL